MPSADEIDRTIRSHLASLRKPGVLTVRPGYEIAGHQLTGRSAIVATVHTKKKDLPNNAKLPNSVGRVPVDVREARPLQRLRAHDPAAAAVAQAYARPEDHEPTWPYEREMPSGKLLDDPQSETQQKLVRNRALQPGANDALAAKSKKQKIDYKGPSQSFPLTPVTITTTITAHVSPDAGFATLQKFLLATQQSLTIGMYDFTSAPILQTFVKALSGGQALQMVLDNPPFQRQEDDQHDSDTVATLRKSGKANIVWALEDHDSMVTAYMFPSAYHIKVIVQDNKALWLSSGNLNNTNQPDPASPPSKEDRDWHVIIQDPGLARTFAAYLDYDYQSATQYQAAAGNDVAQAVNEANAKLALETNPPPPPLAQMVQGAKKPTSTAVAAQTFSNVNVTITPLLTPDLLPGTAQGQYLANITKLIESAQRSLYIQLQYIEASSGNADPYQGLLQTIADRVKAGVDVRLIVNAEYAEKNQEKMKAQGIDLTANIRLQPSVHNKGFVVDSQTCVVSSQNFSPPGVQTNRDAGVIIQHAGIAKYFENVFISDWNGAKPFVARGASNSGRSGAPSKRGDARKPKPSQPKNKPKPKRSGSGK